MSARTAQSTTSNGQTDQTAARIAAMLKEHAELVATYPTQSGASKAQTSRKLGILQMELDLAGVEDYPYWVKPQPIETRSYVFTEQELTDRIVKLRALMNRTDRSDASKATYDRELTARVAEAEKRNVTVPTA